MGKQVTLTFPDPLYHRAEQIAQERERDVTDVLLEFAVLGENVFDENIDEQDESDVLAQEEAAFIRMHPELWEKYPGKYVAIYGDQLIDHDTDLGALNKRIRQQFGDTPVWISPVLENPIEEWVFRSPRLVDDL